MAMANLNFEKQSYLNARAFLQRYEDVAQAYTLEPDARVPYRDGPG